jgi:hypothetical protein
MVRRSFVLVTGFIVLLAGTTGAQTLGTFRWQMQPHCNVLTVSVTATGSVYRVEGTDDQCGGGRDQASVTGLAFPNPDGTIGFGLAVVTAPGGAAVHVDAEISPATLSGTWRTSAGGNGTFTFTPGAPAPGYPRPVPANPVPAAISLRDDGSLVAGAIGASTIPASGPGTRLMWYPGKAAFRAGSVGTDDWDDANVGLGSVALGFSTRAAGTGSTAFGQGSRALGLGGVAAGLFAFATARASVALGDNVSATGAAAVALGDRTLASGVAALAAGFDTTASGEGSVALGQSTVAGGIGAVAVGLGSTADGVASLAGGTNASATGARSTALGTNASTAGHAGSFVYGDASTVGSGGVAANDAPNQFMVRAAGGYKLFSNAARTTGVLLAPNASAWSSLSDRHSKHRFEALDGETVLARLAAMPVQTWSYKAQDDAIRHAGPTAQDFHAAFGLGEDPLRISTIDADGIALAAARALEARTRTQADELSALRAQVEALRRLVAALMDASR